MVFTCAAINCRNTNSLENRAKRITFHRFPRDRIKRSAWALATRRQGFEKGILWKPSNYSVLCSNHFLEEDFDVCKKVRRLKEGVIPSVFDFPDSHIKPKVPLIQQIQKETTVPSNNEETLPSQREKTLPPPSFPSEHSYFRKCYIISNIKSKVPAIKQGQNKETLPNQKKKTVPSQEKKTVPLPSLNIQENSSALECDEVFDIEAIETPLILLSQSKASKNKGILPSQKLKTVPLPSFNIQEHSDTIKCDEVSNAKEKAPVIWQSQEKDSENEGPLPSRKEKTVPLPLFNIQEDSNTIECDEVSNIKVKVPTIQQSQEKDSEKEGALPSQKEKAVSLCSTIAPTLSNIHEHSNAIERQCDEINNLKRKLEASESKYKVTNRKLNNTRALLSRKEKKIEELLNNIEEQKKLYKSVTNDRETAYTDRSTNLQIELITRKPGVPFSEELRTFAKTLRSLSPKAYNFLRDTLNLPHERTLRQYKDNIDDKCTEFPTRTFQVLGEESQKYVATGNNYCRIMVDGKVVNALVVKKYVE